MIAYMILFVDTKVELFLFRFLRILPKKHFTYCTLVHACGTYRTKVSRFCRSGLTYSRKLDCENAVLYCELKLEEEAMHTTTHHDTV